jgi:hypothetical protein
VTEDGGRETGGNTTAERDRQLFRLAQRFLLFQGHTLVRQLVAEFVDGELRDRLSPLFIHKGRATYLSNSIRNLFTDQRQEASVQASKALGSCDFGQAGEHARRVGRLGDEPDSGGFHRREEDVGEESAKARWVSDWGTCESERIKV